MLVGQHHPSQKHASWCSKRAASCCMPVHASVCSSVSRPACGLCNRQLAPARRPLLMPTASCRDVQMHPRSASDQVLLLLLLLPLTCSLRAPPISGCVGIAQSFTSLVPSGQEPPIWWSHCFTPVGGSGRAGSSQWQPAETAHLVVGLICTSADTSLSRTHTGGRQHERTDMAAACGCTKTDTAAPWASCVTAMLQNLHQRIHLSSLICGCKLPTRQTLLATAACQCGLSCEVQWDHNMIL